MIPIQYQRTAFSYAVKYLETEILMLEDVLQTKPIQDNISTLLEKRLKELKNDLKELKHYELHE